MCFGVVSNVVAAVAVVDALFGRFRVVCLVSFGSNSDCERFFLFGCCVLCVLLVLPLFLLTDHRTSNDFATVCAERTPAGHGLGAPEPQVQVSKVSNFTTHIKWRNLYTYANRSRLCWFYFSLPQLNGAGQGPGGRYGHVVEIGEHAKRINAPYVHDRAMCVQCAAPRS